MGYKGKHYEEKNKTSKRLKGKHFDTNAVLKTSYKSLNYFLIIIIMLVIFTPNVTNMLAYFTYTDNKSNAFTIDAEYTIEFNANTGTGMMADQRISYNVATNLNTNTYSKSGYAFSEWNTDPRRCGNIIF